MLVLVACEESQEVCKAFRNRGHMAFSCDIQPCSGSHPEWHLMCDVSEVLRNKWDLIIAHPPCTYLTSAGAMRLYNKDHTIADTDRLIKGVHAKDFFMKLYNADCPRIAIENPTPMKIFNLPKFTQMVEPYMFGDPWHKRTCLWLKGLPKLAPTNQVEPDGYWVWNNSKGGHRNQKMRSKTSRGLAEAMAEQWGVA